MYMANSNNKINYELAAMVVKYLPKEIGEKEGITADKYIRNTNNGKEVYFNLIEKILEKIIFLAVDNFCESEDNDDACYDAEEVKKDPAVIYEIAKVARARIVVG